MAALTNVRHENFAQLVARGKSFSAAYREAGFDKWSGSRACRLAKDVKVRKRIEDLMRARATAADRAIENTGMDRAWVLEQLRENMERAMQVKPVIGPDGKVTGEYEYAGQVANRALELIGKELGMFIERKEQGRPGEFAHLSDEELEERLVSKLKERGFSEKMIRVALTARPQPSAQTS